MATLRRVAVFALCLLLAAPATAAHVTGVEGAWVLNVSASDPIPLFDTLAVNVSRTSARVCVDLVWGPGTADAVADSLCASTDGTPGDAPVLTRVFAANVFMGLEWLVDKPRTLACTDCATATQIVLSETAVVWGSQGPRELTVTHTLTSSGASLHYTLARSTRSNTVSYWFVPQTGDAKAANVPSVRVSLRDREHLRLTARRPPRSDPQHACTSVLGGSGPFFLNLTDDWSISSGGLAAQVLLLSLQGLANRGHVPPRLYFVFPDDWAFSYSGAVLDFYRDVHNMTVQQLCSVQDVLTQFSDTVKGYVVWDEKVPTSMSVALTLAGLTDSVAIGAAAIPLMAQFSIPLVQDFRGVFTNQTDASIIAWSWQQYASNCSHEFVMWLGGNCGDVRYPAVADFGVMHRAFFAGDLSTKPTDVAEFALANRIIGAFQPPPIAVGWHSYCKDAEHYFTTMMSHHGARVHGLNTLPDLSFNFNVPLSPGFVFRNNRGTAHLRAAPRPRSNSSSGDASVLVTCLQSDGLGLGAWNKPGRGSMPYTWEVEVNDLWMQPALLEMFYRQATPNDYFIGALGGPGYMYPKAVPPALLPDLLDRAQILMRMLDLHSFSLMDESEGTTVVGNMNLPKSVVETYFASMPDAVGFVNGYAPTFTAAVQNGRPFMSYDYYLDPDRSVADAVADVRELAAVNTVRPYFLVFHVREFSNIARVHSIFSELGADFGVLHAEDFFQRAGSMPTFATHFEEDPQ